MINNKFGRLKVLKFIKVDKKYRKYYICQCDCGNITKPLRNDVICSGKRTCGVGLCSKSILNLIGNKYEKLTVIKFSHIDIKTKTARWICRCDCGTITKPLLSDNLVRNEVGSCGKKECRVLKNISGQRFGKLTVISLDLNNTRKQSYYVCRCDCGIVKSIRGQSLLEKKTISCGSGNCNGALNNLKGKKFGTLTVLDYFEIINNKTYWACTCDCGNIINQCRSDILKSNINRLCSCNRFGAEKIISKYITRNLY